MFTTSGKITFLESSSEGFNSRQKSVFDELDKIESARPVNRYTEEEFSEAQHKNKKIKVGKSIDLDKFVGCESIFKAPDAPAPKKRSWLNSVPDYQVNPHKWTRYSLSDVPDRDLSDEGNTAAAMAFLRDQGSPVAPIDVKGKIKIAPKFSKVIAKTDVILKSNEIKSKPQHPLFMSSKREMPEYVVGQKPAKKSPAKLKPAEKSDKSVKLDHLFDEDE